MFSGIDYLAVDVTIVIIANLVNLLMTVIFLARVPKLSKVEYVAGIVNLLLALPVIYVLFANLAGGRAWWTYGLLIPFVLFCIMELILDYILRSDFRRTHLLGPYLGLYYLSQFGFIGYSFLVNDAYGFITLVTYFISLAATAYSFAKVRHDTTAHQN